MKKRIALVSEDAYLSASRAQLLHSAGYEVTTFQTKAELLQESLESRFDLLIVGHSLEYKSREKVHLLFRQFNPDSPVLQLIASDEEAPGADLAFDIYKGPGELLQAVESVLGPKVSKPSEP
ncbi:MAG: hypothetical protein ACM3JB_01600 [Acidobacteriaceae bacterium]